MYALGSVASGLLVVLVLLLEGSLAWDYSTTSTYGTTYWSNNFPKCGASTQNRQSPVAFLDGDFSGLADSKRQAVIHRFKDASITNVLFTTDLNAGGLLTAKPLTEFPCMVTVLVNGSQVSTTKYWISSIVFHNGAEHANVFGGEGNGTAPVIAAEVQIFFSLKYGDPPAVMVSQMIVEDPLLTVVKDTSAISEIITALTTSASSVAVGAASLSTTSGTTPNVLFDSTLDEVFAAYRYLGTTSFPPCYPVIIYVLRHTFMMPTSWIQAIATASKGISTVRPLQNRTAVVPSMTVAWMSQGFEVDAAGTLLYTPSPITTVEVTQNVIVTSPANKRMLMAVIALVALNAGLITAIGALVLARLELLDVPMWLGGLSKPVEFWTNPASAQVEGSEDEEEEAQEEEDEEGDEGEIDDEHAVLSNESPEP